MQLCKRSDSYDERKFLTLTPRSEQSVGTMVENNLLGTFQKLYTLLGNQADAMIQLKFGGMFQKLSLVYKICNHILIGLQSNTFYSKPNQRVTQFLRHTPVPTNEVPKRRIPQNWGTVHISRPPAVSIQACVYSWFCSAYFFMQLAIELIIVSSGGIHAESLALFYDAK